MSMSGSEIHPRLWLDLSLAIKVEACCFQSEVCKVGYGNMAHGLKSCGICFTSFSNSFLDSPESRVHAWCPN